MRLYVFLIAIVPIFLNAQITHTLEVATYKPIVQKRIINGFPAERGTSDWSFGIRTRFYDSVSTHYSFQYALGFDYFSAYLRSGIISSGSNSSSSVDFSALYFSGSIGNQFTVPIGKNDGLIHLSLVGRMRMSVNESSNRNTENQTKRYFLSPRFETGYRFSTKSHNTLYLLLGYEFPFQPTLVKVRTHLCSLTTGFSF